jgi:predicted ATPase
VDGASLRPPDPLLSRVIDGKYRIDSKLARGGQGDVYRATHIYLQRVIALKILTGDFASRPELVDRFKREALTLALLKHANVVTVHDFGLTPEVGAYLVMEFVEGNTARDEINHHKHLPVEVAVDIMRQACEAVHAAHQHGIIHRDLKPANIVLGTGPDGTYRVKVLDFGLAKLVEGPEYSDDEITAIGAVVGTPNYMSPEQWMDEQIDARSDIYSLGCVLYELLTGTVPFTGGTRMQVFAKHLAEIPAAPSLAIPGIPPELDAVVLRALAKLKDDRFETAEEFSRALESLGLTPRSPTSDALTALDWSSKSGVGVSLKTIQRLHNFPEIMTSFIGRDREIQEIKRALSTSRLVTLTGPGGSGKTRLAAVVASELLPQCRDGVWLVELAALADPLLVPQTVASALGVLTQVGPPLVSLIDFLISKQILLVLDNCEHLIEACSALAKALLRACSELRILATSQESLGIAGELMRPVPPLSLPGRDPGAPFDDLAQSEAVQLFVDRAALSNARFALTDLNGKSVARICRRLDGIPLAIELAAARLKLMPAEQIAERLDDRFRLLIGTGRSSEARQQTLRAAMDWSFELLTETEQIVFRRLSVFAGGFSLEAAESVIGDEDSGDTYEHFSTLGATRVAQDDVLGLLGRLVDKSLTTVDEFDGSARYALLETIRQYGNEKLLASGEAKTTHARHGAFYLALAERADAEINGPNQSERLRELDLEYDNIRAALEWSKGAPGECDTHLRLACALAKFWYVRSHGHEGRVWLEHALQACPDAPAVVRAKSLTGLAALERVERDYTKAAAYLDESVSLWRQLGDASGEANALNHLGMVAHWQGDYDRAEVLHSEALALARQARDDREAATALNNLGVVSRYRGNYEKAMALFDEGLVLFRSVGDKRYIAGTLNNVGVVAGIRGQYQLSTLLQEEHLLLRRELGEPRGIAAALNNLGETLRRQGEFERAAELLREGVKLYWEAGDWRGLAGSLESLLSLAVAEDRAERAFVLAGATSMLRKTIGSPLSPAELEDLNCQLEHSRTELGDERAEAASASGAVMEIDRLVRFALNA